MKNILLIATFCFALFGCSKTEENTTVTVNPYILYGSTVNNKFTAREGDCSESLYADNLYLYLPQISDYYRNPQLTIFNCGTRRITFFSKIIFVGGNGIYQEPGSFWRYVYERQNEKEIKSTVYYDGKLNRIDFYKQK